jgi:hypothetical protein
MQTDWHDSDAHHEASNEVSPEILSPLVRGQPFDDREEVVQTLQPKPLFEVDLL